MRRQGSDYCGNQGQAIISDVPVVHFSDLLESGPDSIY